MKLGHVINNKAFSETTNYNPNHRIQHQKQVDFFVKAWANTWFRLYYNSLLQ